MLESTLFDRLNTEWTERLESAVEEQTAAEYNLGRLAMIYSGQLWFDFDDNFNPNGGE